MFTFMHCPQVGDRLWRWWVAAMVTVVAAMVTAAGGGGGRRHASLGARAENVRYDVTPPSPLW